MFETAGLVVRVLLPGELQRVIDAVEVLFDLLALETAARKVGQRNSLNGVVSLAKPPTRRNSPASER